MYENGLLREIYSGTLHTNNVAIPIIDLVTYGQIIYIDSDDDIYVENSKGELEKSDDAYVCNRGGVRVTWASMEKLVE